MARLELPARAQMPPELANAGRLLGSSKRSCGRGWPPRPQKEKAQHGAGESMYRRACSHGARKTWAAEPGQSVQ